MQQNDDNKYNKENYVMLAGVFIKADNIKEIMLGRYAKLKNKITNLKCDPPDCLQNQMSIHDS